MSTAIPAPSLHKRISLKGILVPLGEPAKGIIKADYDDLVYYWFIRTGEQLAISNYNNENLLEMVELYASVEDLIASEKELSELFDEKIASKIVKRYGNDKPIMRMAFNKWADSLCKDGEIHPEQYNKYEYVGKYA